VIWTTEPQRLFLSSQSIYRNYTMLLRLDLAISEKLDGLRQALMSTGRPSYLLGRKPFQ
jgi:hypothetical protein